MWCHKETIHKEEILLCIYVKDIEKTTSRNVKHYELFNKLKFLKNSNSAILNYSSFVKRSLKIIWMNIYNFFTDLNDV